MTQLPRVVGIGGVFIRTKDHARMKEWYKQHLDIDTGEWGKTFEWDAPQGGAEPPGSTAWTLFKPDSPYFPLTQSVMINYRVADVHALVATLKAEGCNVDDKVEDTDFGKFGWVTDPEGNRIELWEPPKAKS